MFNLGYNATSDERPRGRNMKFTKEEKKFIIGMVHAIKSDGTLLSDSDLNLCKSITNNLSEKE